MKFPAVAAEYLMDTPHLRTPPLYSFPCWRWTLRRAGALYALTGCCFRLLALFLFPLTHATCHSCCCCSSCCCCCCWCCGCYCVLFRSITVTSARYLSVKTQTHVSTSRSHLLLLPSASPPKLSVIRKIDFKSVEHFSAIVVASTRKGRDTSPSPLPAPSKDSPTCLVFVLSSGDHFDYICCWFCCQVNTNLIHFISHAAHNDDDDQKTSSGKRKKSFAGHSR